METLMQEHERLATTCNLSKSVDDVQKTLDLLTKARESIAANPNAASVILAKLQNPVKQSFDAIKSDLQEVYKGHGRYQKVLDTRFKDKPFPGSDNDALSSQPGLINRAIAMHFLREGQFSVAQTFIMDARNQAMAPRRERNPATPQEAADEALGLAEAKSEELRRRFGNMYHILKELKEEQNLLPAIEWAKSNSEQLETRGSNLEFELGQMQFVYLFTKELNPNDPASLSLSQAKALLYARTELARFQGRYLQEIQELCGAVAFRSNLIESPYRRTFLDDSTWEYLANSFTREFCSLLGLSAESPLYAAATAGAIALPTLLKLQMIMKEKRTEWTTQQELPVEIPLPPAYHYHSIFVCPVSKEQTTDENPPMMLICGHVVAQETLAKMSRGSKFKCPYCPIESKPNDCQKLYM